MDPNYKRGPFEAEMLKKVREKFNKEYPWASERHPMQEVMSKIYRKSRKRDQGEGDERSVATGAQSE